MLRQAVPLVQTRMNLLSEAPDLMSFLFVDEDKFELHEDGLKTLRETAPEVLRASIEVLEPLDDFTTDTLQDVLKTKLVEEMEIKPRFAFGPLRTALSGRRISPPLFESMEILGKDVTLGRLRGLLNHLEG